MSEEVANAEEVGTEEVTQESSSWLDSITDQELKGSKSLANFKDIDGLAKSYIHLEKKLGQPQEPQVEYKAEDYSFDTPENYEANNDIMSAVQAKALEAGVKPEVFKQLAETFIGKESEIIQAMRQEQEQGLKETQESLKKEWGADYDKRLAKADETWQKLTEEGDDKILNSLDPNAKLAIAKLMDNISQKISEPHIGKQAGSPVLTKEEAKSKLEKIYSDPEHAYHKGDAKSVNEVFELSKLAVDQV